MSGEAAWKVLAAELTESFALGSVAVTVLQAPGQALVISLHAAAHGARVSKPLNDLRLALERLPYGTWQAAAALAGRLQATEAFAAGLSLLPQGYELTGRLGLPVSPSVEVVLRASTAPPTALGFEWLSRTPGVFGKARLVARKVAPRGDFMRAWSPLARRGKAGLIAAYVFRVGWLIGTRFPGLLPGGRLADRCADPVTGTAIPAAQRCASSYASAAPD